MESQNESKCFCLKPSRRDDRTKFCSKLICNYKYESEFHYINTINVCIWLFICLSFVVGGQNFETGKTFFHREGRESRKVTKDC